MDIWLFTNECIVCCIVFVSHTRLDLSLVFVQKFIKKANENAQKLLPPELLLLAQITPLEEI